ncbi:hypothetical protein [Methylorubrum extorquens]
MVYRAHSVPKKAKTEVEPMTVSDATPLTSTLIELDALLEAEDVPTVDEAHRLLWDYLSSFDGITQQTRALQELSAAFNERPAVSPAHSMICRLIEQHHRRLAEP